MPGLEWFPVYLITGQSNADGFAPAGELPADLNVPAPFGEDVLAYCHNGGAPFFAPLSALPIQTPGGFITTNESGPAVLGVAGPRFGPEMTFARAIRAAYPGQRFGIIKVAFDASAHFAGLNSNFGLSNHWAPGGGGHRTTWTTRMGLASSALASLGLRMDVRGHLEHLGESDGCFGMTAALFDAAILAYEAGHLSLINFFRDSLVAAVLTRHVGAIPFVQARTSRDWYAEVPDPWQLGVGYSALLNGTTLTRLQGINTLRAAQDRVAKLLPEVYSVETEGLGNNGPGDMIHLNGAGQIQHGENYAAILEQFFEPPTKTVFQVRGFSTRLPLIVRGRGVTDQGRRCNSLAHAVDVHTTIKALEGKSLAGVDGVSLAPTFSNVMAKPSASAYVEHFETAEGNPDGGISDAETGETAAGPLTSWDTKTSNHNWTLITRRPTGPASTLGDIRYELYSERSETDESPNYITAAPGVFPQSVDDCGGVEEAWLAVQELKAAQDALLGL